ncbi:MAG: type II secretion system ATPase GspE [Desulfobacter sp.]|jgi:general secretion pathway protein E|uniref:type II secretion system ATPase GspE n=1 Tax=Desulfobacter sp. TaxID=2294 RepID=UPI001B4C924E|nr:type II secretion system ATPase GspE [Desulfobacter sp.]MBP8828138.1 type II secretion system ATPase GspE [Desulfobacter sp.]MDQ1268890.1 ral secretion pathway protein [Thermodesulfobacteriota bacterium]
MEKLIQQFVDRLATFVILDREQREKIKAACAKDPARMCEMACDTKLVSESQSLKAVGAIYGIEFLEDLAFLNPDLSVSEKITRKFLKKNLIVPLKPENKPPVIALNDPSELSYVDDVAMHAGFADYALALATKAQILSAINMIFDQDGHNVQKLMDDMEDDEFLHIEDIEHTADLLDDTSDAPVIRLVNQMISQSVKAGASDIHIEPFQDELIVRYRIDGILYPMMTPPKMFQSSLISRIKVMAKMNIAEKRIPQDGRAQVRMGNQEIDMRISTVPTNFGERLVIRLLNKSGYFMQISEFGLSSENERHLHDIFRQNHGIVLVTGPTGSGKTTTLYAGLSEINTPDRSIITVEDPVEYNLKGVGQIQVNQKTGLTFARGLRSIVRQDPDVILIGEIRDIETAEIAIQSALTGHLVFSTLHTNDAPGAVTRLVDLGVEPYLITSSVNHVIAQRLVRVLCSHCREEFVLSHGDLSSFDSINGLVPGQKVFRPKGCPKCFNTGYLGRQAIMEIMPLDEELKSLLLETSDANLIKVAAVRKGMKTLRSDGLTKVAKGITSLREVLRVTQE